MLGTRDGASRRVEKVSPTPPAAQAGLRPGDEIVAVNLQPTKTFKQVSKAIRASKGKPVIVSVRRPPGRYLELPPEKTIKQNGYYIYGFQPAGVVYKRYNPATAFGFAARDTWDVTKGIATAVVSILEGPGRQQGSSPVGI